MNLAARLTSVARPGTILVDRELAAEMLGLTPAFAPPDEVPHEPEDATADSLPPKPPLETPPSPLNHRIENSRI